MNEDEQYKGTRRNRLDEILEELKDLKKKLFEDNGGKSLQSRINENALWCHVIKWLVISLSTGVLLGFIGLLFWVIKMKVIK